MSSFKWGTKPDALVRKIKKRFTSIYKDVLKDEILDDITSGVSPVYRQRMVKYSKSYKAFIKRLPTSKDKGLVNLYLTGALHKSLRIKETARGLYIVFRDKKASWHNDGTSKMPRRAILPNKKDERFNNRITKLSDRLLIKIIKQTIKRSK